MGQADTGTGGAGEFLTVRAHALATPTRMADLVLRGPNATLPGHSSYVVHASAANLSLERVLLQCGDGAGGSNGTDGLDAQSLAAAASGSIGGSGVEQVDCNATSHGVGGTAGTNSCSSSPSARNMNGGNGGNGGEMDTSCPFNLTATAGDPGMPASYTNGLAGTPGAGGPANASGCNSGGGTRAAPGIPAMSATAPLARAAWAARW